MKIDAKGINVTTIEMLDGVRRRAALPPESDKLKSDASKAPLPRWC